MKKKIGCLVFLFFLFSLGFPQISSSSGFYMSNFGGSGASALSSGPASIFWNPAGLEPSGKYEFLLDYTQFILSLGYRKNFTYTPDFQTGRWTVKKEDTLPEEHLLNFPPLPFIGGVYKINSRLSAGLAVYTPFGSSVNWDNPSGLQKYHSIKGSIMSIFVSPSLSVKVNRWLKTGVTLSYVHTVIQAEKHLSFADVVGGMPEDETLDAILKMHPFAGDTWNISIGFTWKPAHSVEAGISYSLPVWNKLKGYVEIIPVGEKAMGILSGTNAYADGTMHTTFPQTLKLAVRWKITTVHSTFITFEYVNWRMFDGFHFSFQNTTSPFIPEKMDENKTYYDAYSSRIIYSNLNNVLPFFSGAGFETSAASTLTMAPDMPDFKKVLIFGGVKKNISQNLGLAFDVLGAIFIPQDVNSSILTPPANGHYSGYAVLAHLGIYWTGKNKTSEQMTALK